MFLTLECMFRLRFATLNMTIGKYFRSLYKIVWSLCLVLLAFSVSPAQKVGSTAMQFLHVMPCARATALGNAYSVWASGAEAVFWNPSGLALIQNQELSSTYINWIFDTRQGALSYALPLEDFGAVGVQVQYVDFGEFEETSNAAPYIKDIENPGMTGRTFRPFSYLIGLTYASNLTDKFSTGISLKYAHESLFSGQMVNAMVRQGVYEEVKTWADALLFDFGIRYRTGFRSIQIASSVQNFGANAKYAKESNPVPLLFRFGIAANVIGADALLLTMGDNRLGVAFDLFQPNDYAQQAHLGVEYEFANSFALRGGYKFYYDYEGLTFGGGIKHTFGSVKLSLDYSYGSIGTYLGNVQRISIGAALQ
ncbi:MAG: PorV/PorQ family protein [Bacillota bacterium]|nr:PorV/PorQ family protein [Bacillota bacterium]